MKSVPGPHDDWHFRTELPCVQEHGFLYLAPAFYIRFQHLQLLMNKHRFERPCINHLEALSYTFSDTYKDCTMQGTLRGEIVADQLSLRLSQRLGLMVPIQIRTVQILLRQICPHQGWISTDLTLWNTIKCRLNHVSDSSCRGYSMWKCCRE